MAIYSCNISNVSRAKGSSACATLSYISAEKIVDERLGMTFSYGREERVMLTGTLLPEGAPKEFQDPKVLFNASDTLRGPKVNARKHWDGESWILEDAKTRKPLLIGTSSQILDEYDRRNKSL